MSPDRLSVHKRMQIILMEEFKKPNQRIFTNQAFGYIPEDNLMLQIQGSIAEYERVKILDRMRRGMIHSTKNGQVTLSNPPLGYCYIPKGKDTKGHLEVNPDEAKTVRYIFHVKTGSGLMSPLSLTSKLGTMHRSCSNRTHTERAEIIIDIIIYYAA